MSIIEDIVKDFIEENYVSTDNMNYFLTAITTELSRHRKDIDKINFLSNSRNLIQKMYDDHYISCQNKENCDDLKWHKKSIHYINNMLEDYSIPRDKKDRFSDDEQNDYSNKLDKIIEEIETLKKGQEIIYDGISEEIEELKNLYFLGKKNWKQILVGKAIEMMAGGVVSDTISKELVDLSGIGTQGLLK